MPTAQSATVGSAGGRTYSTLAAAVAAIAADITVTNEIWTLNLYNDSQFAEGVICATTQDATRYVTIQCAAGQSFSDNASVRTNALRYNQSNGVGFHLSTNYFGFGTIQRYTRLIGVQMEQDGAGGSFQSDLLAIVKNCTMRTRSSNGAFKGFQTTFINCIAYCHDLYGVAQGFACGDGYAPLPCTLIGCLAIAASNAAPLGSCTGFLDRPSTTTSTLVSCAAFGFATAASGTWGTSSNNATDAASGLPGSSNQHSVTYSATTPFTQADNTSALDFRAIASTALAANGLLDATNAPLDISGYTRAASPTIGCWELTAAAGGTTPPPFSSFRPRFFPRRRMM